MKLQFDALRSQLIQKQVEHMDHYKIMDMHAPFCHELNSKFNQEHMQAWIMLYINMYELKQDLAPQFDMNHARTSSIHKQEGDYTTLGLQCKIRELNLQSIL